MYFNISFQKGMKMWLSIKLQIFQLFTTTWMVDLITTHFCPQNNVINLLPMFAEAVIACLWIAFGVCGVDGSTATRSSETLSQRTGAQPTHRQRIRCGNLILISFYFHSFLSAQRLMINSISQYQFQFEIYFRYQSHLNVDQFVVQIQNTQRR